MGGVDENGVEAGCGLRWIVRPSVSEGQMRVEGRQVTSGSDAEVREAANSRMRMSTLRV